MQQILRNNFDQLESFFYFFFYRSQSFIVKIQSNTMVEYDKNLVLDINYIN